MDVHDATEQAYKRGYEDGKRDAVKRGRWIEFNTFMTCSECDKDFYYEDNNCDEFDYCPNCGAKMDGGCEDG